MTRNSYQSWPYQSKLAQSISQRAALALLLPLVVVLLGFLTALPSAFARTPGSGAGSEGQGSLPSFAGGTGVALVGELSDVLAVLGEVAGEGDVEFYSLDDTVAVALLTGELRVSVDLTAMAARGVSAHLVLGDALTSGLAEVSYGAWSSGYLYLPEFSLELPLTTLYGPEVTNPNALTLRAVGRDQAVYGLAVSLSDGVLRLEQTQR